jgi:hypothetical protein
MSKTLIFASFWAGLLVGQAIYSTRGWHMIVDIFISAVLLIEVFYVVGILKKEKP